MDGVLMPTTIRIVLAVKQANNYVTENLDDVYNSQYGFHTNISTPIGTEVEVQWPTTGETQVYIRLPQGTVSYVVNTRDQPSDFGWEINVPIGDDFTPLLLYKPSSLPSFFIKTSVLQPLIGLFFF